MLTTIALVLDQERILGRQNLELLPPDLDLNRYLAINILPRWYRHLQSARDHSSNRERKWRLHMSEYCGKFDSKQSQ